MFCEVCGEEVSFPRMYPRTDISYSVVCQRCDYKIQRVPLEEAFPGAV